MNRLEFYDNVKQFKEKDLELKHYGIIGQKWGTRRWQNADGTFNQAGKERYFGSGKKEDKSNKSNKTEKQNNNLNKQKIGSWTNNGKEMEKYYDYGSYKLSNDDRYTSEEQKYLMDKKVAKNVNKMADFIKKDNVNKYEKELSKIDENHRNTIRKASDDVAESIDNYENNKKRREISENILKLHEIEMGQILKQEYDDTEADKQYAIPKQYPIPIRKMITDNIETINSAINKIENGDFNGYMDDVWKASHGDDMNHDYIEHFIDDVRTMKQVHKDEKEINNELQEMKNIQKNFRFPIEYNSDTHDFFPTMYKDNRSLGEKYRDPKVNPDGRKVINNLNKNFDKYMDQFKDKIVEEMYDTYKEWHLDDRKILSKSEFKKNIGKINSGSISNTGDLNLYFEDNNLFYGHVFTSVGTIDNNGDLKIEEVYLEG